MATPKVYALCDVNCRWETMTREEIIAAIAEATGTTPTNIDDAFISKIKEMNAGGTVQIWVGTSAEFNALTEKDNNMLYILTDDDSADSWDNIAENLNGIISGIIPAAKATEAANATNADKINGLAITRDEDGILKIGDTIIPQKKLVFNTQTEIPTSGSVACTIQDLSVGKKYQIDFECGSCVYIAGTTSDGWKVFITNYIVSSETYSIIHFKAYTDEGAIRFMRYCSSDLSAETHYINKIYEIIE